MVGHRLAVSLALILAPILVDIERVVGLAAASPTGSVITRELSRGVTETIRLLPDKEQARPGKRDSVDLIQQNCASSCEGVAGSGPNQADCNQIINAFAQNTATFTMEPYSVAKWVQASCTIKFIQSTADTVMYTYTYLGAVASHLSDMCYGANGYAEGRCIFDGREDAIWIGNTSIGNQST